MGKCQLCDWHANGRLRDREEGSITGIIVHAGRVSPGPFVAPIGRSWPPKVLGYTHAAARSVVSAVQVTGVSRAAASDQAAIEVSSPAEVIIVEGQLLRPAY